MARPKEYTGDKLREIVEDLDKYIEETPIPIIAEFAYTRDIRRATLYEIPELAYSIKRAAEKKEAQLEKLALANKINTTFAIFSLKQLGWKDKTEHEISGDNLINIQIVSAQDEADKAK